MQIEMRRLTAVDPADLLALFNHPDVRRHLPLAQGVFTAADCDRFVAAKERMWAEHGYGPWAFYVGGAFVGWGGLQPEGADADLGLVLHPDHWGLGPRLCREVLRRGFEAWGLESVTILLPPTRTRLRPLRRLGFRPDGEATIAGERFLRFRLHRATVPLVHP